MSTHKTHTSSWKERNLLKLTQQRNTIGYFSQKITFCQSKVLIGTISQAGPNGPCVRINQYINSYYLKNTKKPILKRVWCARLPNVNLNDEIYCETKPKRISPFSLMFRFWPLDAFILFLYGGRQEDCEDHPNELEIFSIVFMVINTSQRCKKRWTPCTVVLISLTVHKHRLHSCA